MVPCWKVAMSPDDTAMVEELRRRGDPVSVRAADRFETYHRMDREAAQYVETVICMRTGFTGYPPYVGWKGLGLALTKALDERDALRNSFRMISAVVRELEDKEAR